MRNRQSKKSRTQDSATLHDPETGIRVEKVREVRQQLGKGTYSVTDRVDTVVEKIIKDLS
jgi:anti-sigma28 factor (negative regulator of flagellin synthesis)